MTTPDELRECPHCGFRDVPTLVVNRSAAEDGGISWRCHSCHERWTDRQYRLLRAS
jgi:transposase-like protein